MEKYSYIAADVNGREVKGVVEAKTRQDVLIKIKDQGHFPLEVALVRNRQSSLSRLRIFRHVSQKEILVFVMQLSTIVKAGMSLIFGLNVIINQVKNKEFKKILQDIRSEVAKGRNFSDVCTRYPKIFPTLFSNIIKAGEESGKLELVLDRYAAYVKNNQKIQAEVKGALAYPAILMVLSVVVMVFLTTFIVPKFAEILKSSGTELPTTTRLLLDFSAFMQANILYVVVGLAALFVAIVKYVHTNSGSYYFDVLKLKIPVLGELIYKTTVSRFVRTMGTLLSSGIPFLKNLKLATDVLNNKAMANKFEKMYDNIAMGEKIGEQFDRTKLFSPMVIQLITIGENSGTLDKMFDEISEIYDREIESSVKNLTTSLEPIVLIIVATGIGFIAVSLISAVMKAVSSFK
ncbi:MAG: type II secretion system F family protein [Candidatus Zhuqueibacterota bacterium]